MNINVIGYGVMGRQIASLLYLLGCSVSIYSRTLVDEKQFMKQLRVLRRQLESVTEGSVSFCNELSELPSAVTIECVIEKLSVKRSIYKEIRRFNSELYFSNTSSFLPNEIGEDVCGLHFFNPISLKLIELYVKDDVMNQIADLIYMLELGSFKVVRVNSNRGYIGNFVLFNEIASVFKLIEKFDYSIEQINIVYSKMYGDRDVFLIVDLIGIDVVYEILKNLNQVDSTLYLPNTMKVALSKNIYGRKNRTSIKDVVNAKSIYK